MTPKAETQIVELKHDIQLLQEREKGIREQQFLSNDMYTRQMYSRELSRLYSDIARKEETLKTIEEQGISSHERGAIIKALTGFHTLSSDKSLGSRRVVAVGYVKTLDSYAVVTYTKWSGFMRNVQGMASMAGKTEIDNIELISEVKYQQLLKEQRRTQ